MTKAAAGVKITNGKVYQQLAYHFGDAPLGRRRRGRAALSRRSSRRAGFPTTASSLRRRQEATSPSRSAARPRPTRSSSSGAMSERSLTLGSFRRAGRANISTNAHFPWRAPRISMLSGAAGWLSCTTCCGRAGRAARERPALLTRHRPVGVVAQPHLPGMQPGARPDRRRR